MEVQAVARPGRARPAARSAARSAASNAESAGGRSPAARSRCSVASADGVRGRGRGRWRRLRGCPWLALLGGRGGLGAISSRQPAEPLGGLAAGSVPARMGIEHHAAAERVRRGDLADHEPVAGRGDQRAARAGAARSARPARSAGRHLAGAVMDLDPSLGVDARRPAGRRRGRSRSAPDRRSAHRRARPRPADPGQVHGDALAGAGALDGLVMDLQSANPDPAVAGQQRQLVARARSAGPQRPGDDRAGAADRERAVDVQPRGARPPRLAAGSPARPARSIASRSASRPAPVAAADRDRLDAGQQLRRLAPPGRGRPGRTW